MKAHKANLHAHVHSGHPLYLINRRCKICNIGKEHIVEYAVLNPYFKKNIHRQQAVSPGHIFWQALNDANGW